MSRYFLFARLIHLGRSSYVVTQLPMSALVATQRLLPVSLPTRKSLGNGRVGKRGRYRPSHSISLYTRTHYRASARSRLIPVGPGPSSRGPPKKSLSLNKQTARFLAGWLVCRRAPTRLVFCPGVTYLRMETPSIPIPEGGSPRARRYKLLLIDPTILIQNLLSSHSIRVVSEMPPDIRVANIAVVTDYQHRTHEIAVVVESTTFDHVPYGTMLPEFRPAMEVTVDATRHGKR